MILVADIGASRMRVAVGEADAIEEPLILNTPQDFNEGVTAFAKAAKEVAKGRLITRGAVGIAGLLSRDRHVLLRSPNLPGWNRKDVAKIFSEAADVSIKFENDVGAGALGEAHYGAGVGSSIIAYIAVGTDVNGARVVDGSLDPTAFGFEIGQQVLGIDARAPMWGPFVSGSGLEKKYGKKSSEISDPAIWEECADHFAYGLYNSILYWSPDSVVLGGTLFTAGAIPIERVRIALQSINLRLAEKALPELPDIKLAALGDRSGLYGALALATE